MLLRAVVVLAALALAAPASASAHGLTGRADLPIPIWLFSWGAAVVMVLSFAALATLWSRPRLEDDRFRPLPDVLGRVLTSRGVEILCGLVGVLLLVVVIVCGFAGAQVAPRNLTPTFVYVVFWLGFVPVSVVFGDVFRAFNPWRAVGRAVGALLRRLELEPLPYPERLGLWPAAAGLLAFAWLELVSPYGDRPSTIAWAIVVYSLVTWIAMGLYGVEAWVRRGEAFSVYFGLFARLSVFELRGRVLGLRPFLSGLARAEAPAGTIAVVMVMIGTVTFDGISSGPTWLAQTTPMTTWVTDLGFPTRFGVEIVFGAGLLAVVALLTLVYRLAAGAYAGRYALSMVPIALAYCAAHYVSLLLFTGQNAVFLASDPLGRGWDLFGTADGRMSFFVSAEVFWYLQVFFVVGGHVAAIVLAHDRALVMKAGRRSQRAMLAVMVGFTVLALWLLSEASKG